MAFTVQLVCGRCDGWETTLEKLDYRLTVAVCAGTIAIVHPPLPATFPAEWPTYVYRLRTSTGPLPRTKRSGAVIYDLEPRRHSMEET